MTHGLKLLPLLTFFVQAICLGQTPLSVVNNPDLSYTCKQMLKELDEKHQDLLLNKGLIIRNRKLQKDLPKRKQAAKKRMRINLSRLRHELELGELKYRRMKEIVIRKGCPGVIL
jgi:hypothetical protein